ncbi:MAG: DUF3597 domain-containing protein [Piscinibacter sp.]
MSIFSSILDKILPGRAQAAPAPGAPPAAGAAPAAAPAAGSAAAPAGAPAAGAAPVDVSAMLTDLADKAGETLNWKTSIVDLLKLLKLDSSLTARKELAKELKYTGSTDDTATMNVWLIKEVMKKLAENGGKVPDELKH